MTAKTSVPAARTPGTVRVEVMDHFRLLRDHVDVSLTEPAERLAAYLVLAERPQARDVLATRLWPDRRESDARTNLRRTLWLLNRDAPGLVVRSGAYLTISDAASLDLRDLRALADDAERGVDGVIDPAAIRLLEGDLLPQWTFDWLVGSREALRQLRLHTLEALARARLDALQPASALRIALAAVGVDPLRESAHRIVLAAHLTEDNNAAAVLHYAHYRDLLWREMGLVPGRQMQAMMAEVCPPVEATGPEHLTRR